MTPKKKARTRHFGVYLARWEIVIALAALAISVLSLTKSLHSERASRAPNIQIESLLALHDTEHDTDMWEREIRLVRLYCTAVLVNWGRAPAEIIDVSWETLSSGGHVDRTTHWLGISDMHDPTDLSNYGYFIGLRDNPVLGIMDPVIQPSERESLRIGFFAQMGEGEPGDIGNVRLTLSFSNGQVLTILPDIELFGGSIGW